MFVLALVNISLREGILITVAAALCGMAFGRMVSGIIDRPKALYPNWFYFAQGRSYCDNSHSTSDGALSGRSPRQLGCRRCPSGVISP